MAVNYNQDAKTARLNGIVAAIGASGSLILWAGATAVATFALANPCGTVSGSVLTLSGAPITVIADGGGTLTTAQVLNSDGSLGITGLSIGLDGSSNIVVSSISNSLAVTAGQLVSLLAGEISTP